MALTAADKLEILDLVARYNHAVDSGNGPAYADTYTDDGVFEYPRGRAEGRQGLIDLVQAIADHIPGVRHWSGNWVIEGDGDHATMRCYLLNEATAGRPQFISTGIYHDTLQRVNRAWKFTRRIIKNENWTWEGWP